MTHERLIPSLNDADIIAAFESVAEGDSGLKLAFHGKLGGVDGDELEKIRDLGAHFLESAVLSYESVSWTWRRGSDQASWDRLQFSHNQRRPAPPMASVAEISASLDRALVRPLATATFDNSASVTPATQREILLALEGAVARLVSDTADYRRELDNAFTLKEEKLIQRIDDQRNAEIERLAGEKERADAELARRQAAIDEKQSELDLQQKQLDDRNNTHVRREIRSSLMSLTKDRLDNFSVSKTTKIQYMAVHAVCVIGLVSLVYGGFYFAAEAVPALDIGQSEESSAPAYLLWAMVAKAGLLATVAIAIGTWYLKWLNRWLQRIADAEFKLQQFRLDIERASWLAETVLEWKSMSEEPFPDLLVTRLSTGLFEAGQHNVDDPRTPATQLAEALLGSASTAKIKIGSQELAFDRRGLRNLKNRAEGTPPESD